MSSESSPYQITNGEPYQITYAPHKRQAFGDEEIRAVTECLKDGWLAPGPRTAEFERRVSAFFGKSYGVFVNSGSSANLLALKLAGVGPGVKVVTCALTFATTVAPILQLGGEPVYVDAEEGHYVPSAAAVNAALEASGASIVILANLVGEKPDWERVNGFKIEDSCDTMTTTRCTDISTTSFYASHVITAGGTGGMVMMNLEAMKRRALRLRDWGRAGDNDENVTKRFNHDWQDSDFLKGYDHKFLYTELGYNFKACEMNAAFGLVQLNRLDANLAQRKANVARYVERLQGTEFLSFYRGTWHSTDWLAMPLVTTRRRELAEHLARDHIQMRVCFAGNITRHPAFACGGIETHAVSDDLMMRGFLVGAHHGMTVGDVDVVCDSLLRFVHS